mmetsp:Transcript_15634/g.33799  ORF Transcript_15634/g.33799 Transcript_15634/m.33799 type:complete len:409 (+) Transcript_15634:134-1360(+)
MSLHSNALAAMLRLWMVCLLLSGDWFVFRTASTSSSPTCTFVCVASAQGNDKNKQDDKNKNKNKKTTESPTATPTAAPKPTPKPTRPPTRFPTHAPTHRPTLVPSAMPTGAPSTSSRSGSPSYRSLEALLPELTFEIVTVVDDVFSFASLLEQHNSNNIANSNANNIANSNSIANNYDDYDDLNAFFRDFFVDLLVASRVVSTSALDSVDLGIQFLPSQRKTRKITGTTEAEASGSAMSPWLSGSRTAANAAAATAATATLAGNPNDTPMRIVIDGTMIYRLDNHNQNQNQNVLLLEDKISHTLAVYFSFWSTDEMTTRLEDYGFKDPRITAVWVDDKVILVADKADKPNANANANATPATNANDNDNKNINTAAAMASPGNQRQSTSTTPAVGSALLGLLLLSILAA